MGILRGRMLWGLSLCFFVSLGLSTTKRSDDAQLPKRIGIIGGGIGGCAASLFLRDLVKNKVDVVVYEGGEIGGRVRSIKLGEKEYEAGASILHHKNQLFQRLIKRYGLQTLEADDNDDRGSIICDGAKVLFRSSSWTILNAVKALFRYGISPLKLKPWVDDYVSKFAKIYELLGQNCSYSRPFELIYAADADLVDMFYLSLNSAMKQSGFSQLFITEVGGAAMRVNYNQETGVPAFVGSISLAGMEGPILRVKGGNQQLPHLACQSASTIIKERVMSVQLLNDTTFLLVDETGEGKVFDFVIVASPLMRNTSNVHFTGFPTSFLPEDWTGSYQTTIATFVEGEPNYKYFGCTSSLDNAINIDPYGQWSSMGRLSSVMGSSSAGEKGTAWKLFSRSALSDTLLSEMFSSVKAKSQVDWKAYPNYSEPPPYPPPFVLHRRLFYLNAIEWLGSAMEMSLIAANNIATSISNDISGRYPHCPVAARQRHKEL